MMSNGRLKRCPIQNRVRRFKRRPVVVYPHSKAAPGRMMGRRSIPRRLAARGVPGPKVVILSKDDHRYLDPREYNISLPPDMTAEKVVVIYDGQKSEFRLAHRGDTPPCKYGEHNVVKTELISKLNFIGAGGHVRVLYSGAVCQKCLKRTLIDIGGGIRPHKKFPKKKMNVKNVVVVINDVNISAPGVSPSAPTEEQYGGQVHEPTGDLDVNEIHSTSFPAETAPLYEHLEDQGEYGYIPGTNPNFKDRYLEYGNDYGSKDEYGAMYYPSDAYGNDGVVSNNASNLYGVGESSQEHELAAANCVNCSKPIPKAAIFCPFCGTSCE